MKTLPNKDYYIDYLVKRKFNHVESCKDYIVFSIFNRLTSEEQEKIRIEAGIYCKELQGQSIRELSNLYLEEKVKEAEEKQLLTEEQRFFHKPQAQADFEYWSKMTSWESDEFIALAFGKNPEIVNWKSISSYRENSPFAKEYSKLRTLVLNAIQWKKLFPSDYTINFVRWAELNIPDFPQELIELVKKRSTSYLDWYKAYNQLQAIVEKQKETIQQYKEAVYLREQQVDGLEKQITTLIDKVERDKVAKNSQEKGLHSKERDTLLRLFIGMAASCYGDDEVKSGNVKAKEIADEILRTTGISLDDDTVRKHLKKAISLLPIIDEQK